jgi:hypothetical protein
VLYSAPMMQMILAPFLVGPAVLAVALTMAAYFIPKGYTRTIVLACAGVCAFPFIATTTFFAAVSVGAV